MGLSKNAARPGLSLVMMLAGATAMGSLAIKYITLIGILDKQASANKQGSVKFLGVEFQGQNLTTTEQFFLFLAFVVVGIALGILLAQPIYAQMAKTRKRIEGMSAQEIWGGVLGLVLGLLITVLLISVMQPPLWLKITMALVVSYVCMFAIVSTKEQFPFFFPNQSLEKKTIDSENMRSKILDTNVIIDGRIADVCKAGFLEGPILIPRFVLEELQQIADSSDPLKRARGRRGLDILNAMQKELHMQVKTVDTNNDYASEDVDSRLVRLAQEIDGSVVTNDFNLNKVAALQGVQVLNVNELANALKPVVLPGEEMSVLIIKEGKEANQGIGYMDDGTMIVVEGGRRFISETLDVIVTSVLQTVAGKMIFANIKSEHDSEEAALEHNVRSYSSGRQRKKIR